MVRKRKVKKAGKKTTAKKYVYILYVDYPWVDAFDPSEHPFETEVYNTFDEAVRGARKYLYESAYDFYCDESPKNRKKYAERDTKRALEELKKTGEALLDYDDTTARTLVWIEKKLVRKRK